MIAPVTIACIRDVSERREQADRDRRHAHALEQAQFEMLARLAAVAEFRDDDTGQHTRRVGDLSVAIAERLGLPETQLDLMRLAAPLHDVGKIAIPDAVLGKPGKLTVAEFEEMKTHTTVGAQMLAGSGFELLELAEEIALTHHERWDGSGYPAGLAGDGDPDRRAHRRRRRRLRRAHPRAPVQAGLERRRRARGDDGPVRPSLRPGRPRGLPRPRARRPPASANLPPGAAKLSQAVAARGEDRNVWPRQGPLPLEEV